MSRVTDRPAGGVRPSRRGRPARISRDQIVEAAVELGLDGVTMQGLAERLGVTTPALYSHVAGRDQVLDLVNAELVARMGAFSSPATHWRDWFADFAEEIRTHLAPSASTLIGDLRGPATTVRLGMGEQGLRLMMASGFSPADAGRAMWLVFRTAITAGPRQDGAALAGFVDDTGAVLGPAAPTTLPATQAVHAALAGDASHDTFDFDLQAVLDGIAARLGAVVPTTPSTPRRPS